VAHRYLRSAKWVYQVSSLRMDKYFLVGLAEPGQAETWLPRTLTLAWSLLYHVSAGSASDIVWTIGATRRPSVCQGS
jgi:hypothetical protein